MRTYGLILAGAMCVAGGAQAQTQTLIDTSLDVPTYLQSTSSFTLSSASSVFIEGAMPSDSQVEGIGFLSEGGTLLDTFALTDGSGNLKFNQFNLSAGTYTFQYDFSNNTPVVGGTVVLTATVSPVAAPEIDPSSAMAGLTLLGGGLATLRGRRFKSTKA
jgi:hypothetical protein